MAKDRTGNRREAILRKGRGKQGAKLVVLGLGSGVNVIFCRSELA